MSNSKSSFRKFFDNVILLVILAVVVYFIIRNPVTAKNILLVMLGFGAVIMIHEFGHFIVAKLGGIMVEGFSIGFPPTLLAIKRTEKGMRIRLLPKSDDEESASDEEKTDNLKNEAVEKLYSKNKKKAWETEYRIGMIPFGGYVKMLGQEDFEVDTTGDVGQRITQERRVFFVKIPVARVLRDCLTVLRVGLLNDFRT